MYKTEAIDLIKDMLADLKLWSEIFPNNSDTNKLIERAKKFLEEHDVQD